MTGPRTILAAILQDAYTAGYAAPAFVIRSKEDGLSVIPAAASQGSPLVLALDIARFPAASWNDACSALTESAQAAYGEDFAFALALIGLEDASLIPQAAAAGFAMCGTPADDCAKAAVEAGMLALRDCSLEQIDRIKPGPDDVLAFAAGVMPEFNELARATSMLPNVPLALRPEADGLAPAEPAGDSLFPSKEYPIRSAVRTGVCLVIFETDGAPTSEQVAEAVRLTAAQGAAQLMERST